MRLDEKLGVDPRDCFGGKRRSKLIFVSFFRLRFAFSPLILLLNAAYDTVRTEDDITRFIRYS